MVASSDMLCYCYKSVWINPTEVIKKNASLMSSYLNHVLLPRDINHLIPWLLLSSRCVLVSSNGLSTCPSWLHQHERHVGHSNTIRLDWTHGSFCTTRPLWRVGHSLQDVDHYLDLSWKTAYGWNKNKTYVAFFHFCLAIEERDFLLIITKPILLKGTTLTNCFKERIKKRERDRDKDVDL